MRGWLLRVVSAHGWGSRRPRPWRIPNPAGSGGREVQQLAIDGAAAAEWAEAFVSATPAGALDALEQLAALRGAPALYAGRIGCGDGSSVTVSADGWAQAFDRGGQLIGEARVGVSDQLTLDQGPGAPEGRTQ